MIISSHLTQPRRVYLDVVRALAALSVLFGHAFTFFLKNSFWEKVDLSAIGVFVFFIISGFLISLSVFRKHSDMEYGFRAYLIDRFSRIYCAYIPALVFVWLVDSQISASPRYEWSDRFNFLTFIGNMAMLQNFPLFQVARRLYIPENILFFRTFGSAGSFWTISIEWWLYIVFGMLTLIRLRRRKPFTPLQTVLFIFAMIEPVYYFVGGTDQCLSMLWIIGMCMSLLFLWMPQGFKNIALTSRRWAYTCSAVFFISCLAMAARLAVNTYHKNDSNIAELQFGIYLTAAIFSVFFGLSVIPTVPKLLEKCATFVAGYSYSLYLTHYTVLYYLSIRFPDHTHDGLFFWKAIILSNVTAIIFWQLFERHYHVLAKFLRRLFIPSSNLTSPVNI